MKKSRVLTIIFLIAIFGISYLSIFKNLDAFQIRMWDEATYANNSIDMYENGNYISATHLGKTDWYNTKPTFVIWTQCLAMKFFGVNEFAVRFPSAIFGLLTAILVFVFCSIVFENKIIGFFSSAVLLTSQGYITSHVVLTGDLDSSLVFWLSAGMLVFIYLMVTEKINKTPPYIILSLSLIFGFLSKGIAGFLFIPAAGIIFLIANKFKFFRGKKFYFSIFAAFVICFIYYLIREIDTPGYLKIVWNTEIMRISDEVMSWHVHPFDFYFRQIITAKFNPQIYFLLLIFPAIFIVHKNKVKFNSLLYLLIAVITYFLIISFPAVKLEWYDAPLYPLLAIIIALAFFEVANFILIKINSKISAQIKETMIVIAGVLLLIFPFTQIIKANEFPEKSIYYMELEGAYVKYIVEKMPEIEKVTVYKIEKNIELYDQIVFYKRAFAIQNKLDIRITDKLDFMPGELVMIHKEDDKSAIFKTYKVSIIDQWKEGVIFKITGKI